MKINGRVLLIDDDTITNFISSKAIKAIDPTIEILIVQDGQKGIEKLDELLQKNEPLPNVILLDINMPIMDGWEVLDIINQRNDPQLLGISIYLYTSSVYIEDKNKAALYSIVKKIISKPFNTEIIKEILVENNLLVA
jgi:CheY-like chemotaxis protein